MVISGGVNIYPAEIEDVFHRHPAIAGSPLLSFQLIVCSPVLTLRSLQILLCLVFLMRLGESVFMLQSY
jgi:acyl-CoA synthetase (AMP-forming)/AMP-acid ligase II